MYYVLWFYDSTDKHIHYLIHTEESGKVLEIKLFYYLSRPNLVHIYGVCLGLLINLDTSTVNY